MHQTKEILYLLYQKKLLVQMNSSNSFKFYHIISIKISLYPEKIAFLILKIIPII